MDTELCGVKVRNHINEGGLFSSEPFVQSSKFDKLKGLVLWLKSDSPIC